MKILILSFCYPPQSGMAALRVGHLTDFLLRSGEEVLVISARLPANHPEDPVFSTAPRVKYTSWFDINFAPNLASRFKNQVFGPPTDEEYLTCQKLHDNSKLEPHAILSSLDRMYRSCLNIPDAKIGWLPFALRQGWRAARTFRPDVIYASSPPPTCLVVGACLGRWLSVPWIAEIRDRWAADPYDPKPRWRMLLDQKLERKVLSSARGIVTVSETWAELYQKQYSKPTAVVYNGFVLEDYSQLIEPRYDDSETLRIVYTGAVYAGRDPTPLWQALNLMGDAANTVRVEFYGAKRPEIIPAAKRYGVSNRVHVGEAVSHKRAIELQCRADILLILQKNHLSEAGNIPGKLFEYLGARRPILALGYSEGEMARIIAKHSAGFFSNEPDAIANRICKWQREKHQFRRIPHLPASVRAGFSRAEQFDKLKEFLESV